jgi:hypothetical protein
MTEGPSWLLAVSLAVAGCGGQALSTMGDAGADGDRADAQRDAFRSDSRPIRDVAADLPQESTTADAMVDAGPAVCLIGGLAYVSGDVNPANPCQGCWPATSTSAWSDLPDETSCSGGACCSGTCVDEQTDNLNCGGCGLTCSSGCLAGECLVTLASGHPIFVAVDAASVYWTDGSGTIMKVPLGGGTPTTLASGQNGPWAIAVDATSLYWTESYSVMSVPLGGGTTTTLATGQDSPGGIAVDATSVYWPNETGRTVMSVPLAGGIPTTLASGRDDPSWIAVNATSVYWTDLYAVMSVPLAGGTATTNAAGVSPWAIALSGTNVYWTVDETPTGFIMTDPLGGGTPTTLASGQPDPYAIVVDGVNAYWTDNAGAAVVKAPLGGGSPTTIATGSMPWAIAIDATSVYWTDYMAGTVNKVTPK